MLCDLNFWQSSFFHLSVFRFTLFVFLRVISWFQVFKTETTNQHKKTRNKFNNLVYTARFCRHSGKTTLIALIFHLFCGLNFFTPEKINNRNKISRNRTNCNEETQCRHNLIIQIRSSAESQVGIGHYFNEAFEFGLRRPSKSLFRF